MQGYDDQDDPHDFYADFGHGDLMSRSKAVFRLLARDPSIPVYQRVEVNERLVRQIVGCAMHLLTVRYIAEGLRTAGDFCLEAADDSDRALPAGFSSESEALLDLHVPDGHALLDLDLVTEVLRVFFDALTGGDFTGEWGSSPSEEAEPVTAEGYHDRGNIRALEGKFDAALGDYTKAVQLNPDLAAAYHSRANLLHFKFKNSRCAVRDIERVLELGRRQGQYYYVGIHLLRCRAYARLGEVQKVFESLEDCLGYVEYIRSCCTRSDTGWPVWEDGTVASPAGMREKMQEYATFCRNFIKRVPPEQKAAVKRYQKAFVQLAEPRVRG